jgi:hypothetical protein
MINERVYENPAKQIVKYFIGREVEKTPAYGTLTLFVVGIQNVSNIIQRAIDNNIEHIYLAANQSFELHTIIEWTGLIKSLLDKTEYKITIDHPLDNNEELNKNLESYSTHKNLIPMISVPIANIIKINYNTTIKFDDVGFNETNPGVWCERLGNLLDKNQFTDWTEYTKDRIIE